MKITKVTVSFSVAPPRAREIRDALQLLDGGGSVEVRIEGSDGLSDVVTGMSSTGFGRLRSAPGILAKIIEDELAPAIIGQDPFLIRGIRDQLWSLTEYHGTAGIALMGIAAIDIALWDLVGYALNSPVWRLLGPVRNRIPAYAMVGWLNFSVEELKPIAEKAVAQGFRGVKMKVGAPTLEEDIERIEAVRSIIGRDLRLMVDANQTFALPEAIRRGRVYQELGCYWFEEPLRADNHAHLAELASVLDIRIASGENDFGKRQFRDLFERRAVDVVQPDASRLPPWLMHSTWNTPRTVAGRICIFSLRCRTRSIWRAATCLTERHSTTVASRFPRGPGSAGRFGSTERSGPEKLAITLKPGLRGHALPGLGPWSRPGSSGRHFMRAWF